MQDTSAAIVMQINVTTKQKITNLIFHTSLKSTFARSPNNNTGNGIKKTNLFIFAANSSSIQPSFLNSIPSIIIKKIGTVAFRLKTKFSILLTSPLLYSVRSAVTGSLFAAFFDGISPPSNVRTTLNKISMIAGTIGRTAFTFALSATL